MMSDNGPTEPGVLIGAVENVVWAPPQVPLDMPRQVLETDRWPSVLPNMLQLLAPRTHAR